MTVLVLYNRFMDSEREKKENVEEKRGHSPVEDKGGQRGHSPVEDKEGDLCPICLRSIGDVDCYVTKCGHKFHGSCMLKWCEIKRDTDKEVCPMCRGELKNNINFPRVTKKLVHDFLRILKSHNAPHDAVGEEVLWMHFSTGCQQELIEALEYHYFISEEVMYIGTERERRQRLPYNFSLSDLNFHI